MSTLSRVVQYRSSELERLQDLAQLREQEAKLKLSRSAPNTVKAYAASWKNFANWCAEWRHCESLPATSDVVREFLTWGCRMRVPAYKPSTIQLALAAIRSYHRQAGCPLPADDEVRGVLAGIVRQAARAGARPELAGKKHLTVAQLKKLCHSLGTEPIDLRNRALVVIGFVTGLRRSDLARLDTSHVHSEGDRLRIWVPHSKTDQLGSGRDVYIDAAGDPYMCPIRAFEAWKKLRLEYFGYFRGPLFLRFDRRPELIEEALSSSGISRTFKRALERSGVDSTDYGAHSMRSGMITAADAAGASLRSIMDHTGHRSMSTVMRYVKSVRGSNPLAGVL